MTDVKNTKVPLTSVEDKISYHEANSLMKYRDLVKKKEPAKENALTEDCAPDFQNEVDKSAVIVVDVKKAIAAEEPTLEENKTKILVTLPVEQEKIVSTREDPKSEMLAEHFLDSEKEDLMPLNDSKSLLETESFTKERLEELKEKRDSFALQISDLQAKVMAFKRKTNPTDDDIANLKKYHIKFLEKMREFQELTQKVKHLMGLAQVSSQIKTDALQSENIRTILSQEEPCQSKSSIEENLPKLLVCSTGMGDSITQINCEPLKNRSQTGPFHDHQQSGWPELFHKDIPIEYERHTEEHLKEANEIHQEYTADEQDVNNINLKKHQEPNQEMAEDRKEKILGKESENYKIENENGELKRKPINHIMVEDERLKMLCYESVDHEKQNENTEMKMKLMNSGQEFDEGKIYKQNPIRMKSSDSAKFFCTSYLQNPEQNLENLEKDIEMICCQQESLQTPLLTKFPEKPTSESVLPQKATQTDEDKMQYISFDTDNNLSYRELAKQYEKLNTDFKDKLFEVTSLKVDLEKNRADLNDITVLHHELEEMHQKVLETNSALLADKNKIKSSKDCTFRLDQEDNFAVQTFTNGNEELEGMKALIADLATQLDEYRNKYMKTLQMAEELKKQKEILEIEYTTMNAIEVQKLKLENQEYLKELVPMKELLTVNQLKLREREQMHTTTLETVAQLSQKLETALKELEMANLHIQKSGTSNKKLEDLQHNLEVADKKITELENENVELKEIINCLEQLQPQQNHKLEEKTQEVQILQTKLEMLQEDSVRQISQLKEQKEMIRKCLQMQIADLEREVAMCRAESSCANKERDKMRSKLQLEIFSLSRNFQESQNQILQLQQQINYLIDSQPTSFIDLCK